MSDRKAMIQLGYGVRFMGDVDLVLKLDELIGKLKPVNERYLNNKWCLYGDDSPRVHVQILDRDFVYYANEEAFESARSLADREELDDE